MMREQMERQLLAAAAAADDLVSTWAHPDEQRPLMPRTPERRRWSVPILASVAAIVVLAVALAFAIRLGRAGKEHASTPPAASGNPAATPTASPNAPAAGRTPPEIAERVLGSALAVRNPESIWRTDGSYAVAGEDWEHGKHLATVTISVSRATTRTAANPCILAPKQRPGRQRAPAPEDVCHRYSPGPGITVWFWSRGFSADRPWTTHDTIDWEFAYLRDDGADVRVDVNNLVGDPNSFPLTYASRPFHISKATLLAITTSTALRLSRTCSNNCLEPPDPPTGP
jgi:hypothetical protein